MSNTFPTSGYHNGFSTTNRRSVFDFVQPNEMYTVGMPAMIGHDTRVLIQRVVDKWILETGQYDTVPWFRTDDDAPYGWLGVAQKSDGLDYVGSFPKRVASYFWKTHRIKLPQEVMSSIGNYAGKDAGGNEFYLRFDPYANYRCGQFGDSGSCFWGDRQMARVILRNEGGCFVEFFSKPEAYISNGYVRDGDGLGRCWIVPVDQFTDYDEPLFLLCNVYTHGTINKYNATRAVATILGMTYRHHPRVSAFDTFYINGDCGMLLGTDPEHILDVVNKTLYLHYDTDYNEMNKGDPVLDYGREYPDYDDDRHCCDRCGNYVDDDDWTSLDMCRECAEEHHTRCYNCGEWEYNDDTIEFAGEYFCEHCADSLDIHWCEECETYSDDTHYYADLNMTICSECFTNHFAKCEQCDTNDRLTEMYQLKDGTMVCDDCITDDKRKEFFRCEGCGEIFHISEVGINTERSTICSNCAPMYVVCPSCNVASRNYMWSRAIIYDTETGPRMRHGNVCPKCGQERITVDE